MEEAKICQVPMPEVTLEDVFRAEGADYTKRSPRPNVLELHKRVLQEAEKIINPTSITREINIVGSDQQQLWLEGGYILTCKLLTKVAETADKLILFAMTIGNAYEERVTAYTRAGKTMEAFILDSVGTAFIGKGSMNMMEQLKKSYKKSGLKTTFPMGPGHSYWDSLEDMKTICDILKPERIGIKLTKSNLMIPKKSILFVMGVGTNLPEHHDKSHCDFCSIKNSCHMRNFDRSK